MARQLTLSLTPRLERKTRWGWEKVKEKKIKQTKPLPRGKGKSPLGQMSRSIPLLGSGWTTEKGSPQQPETQVRLRPDRQAPGYKQQQSSVGDRDKASRAISQVHKLTREQGAWVGQGPCGWLSGNQPSPETALEESEAGVTLKVTPTTTHAKACPGHIWAF